jgi:hypothetical protein
LFPDDIADQANRSRAIRDLATGSMALGKAVGAMRGRAAEAGSSQQKVKAMRGIYRAPWQLALQIWLEGVAPGERTFTRASRRGNDRSDVVMPGRKRYSWMLRRITYAANAEAPDAKSRLQAKQQYTAEPSPKIRPLRNGYKAPL